MPRAGPEKQKTPGEADLHNPQKWLTAKEIKMLDNIDMRLLRAGMMVLAKSSRCLLLLELGLVSVKFILKRKRLGYLHYLLTSEDQNLAKMVQQEQVRSPNKWE